MTVPVTITDRTAVIQASNTGGGNNGPDKNDQGEATGQGKLGIRVQDITSDMARQLRLPVQDGVYVSAVQQDSAADDAGIERGMIITRIIAGNQRFDIRNSEDFRRAERALKSGQDIALTVLRQRGGQFRSELVPLTIP